ncbi:MAG: DUF5996 family protein [Pyrinomonadaceae bacterium]
MKTESLPELPLTEWQDTLSTLHMWSQIVGKIRTKQTPLVNHFWNTTLYVTPRGLTTSIIPYNERGFEMEFDFIDHELLVKSDDGADAAIKLYPRSVANFYEEVMRTLDELNLNVRIWTMPVEVENPIRFTDDEQHAAYDAEYANRFWRILVWTDKIFKEFRSRFIGKCSPSHFFWGSFDMAVTRFNGMRAPEREDADFITREAYSHKCISHGFWCGGGAVKEPAFYAYAAPEPDGFKEAGILPASAYYQQELKEFILPYEAVRQSDAPEKTLLDFMQSTYEAGADLDHWNRSALEREQTA